MPKTYSKSVPSSPVTTAEKPVRKAISTRTRFEIFKRDGFKCLYCGATPPNALLEVEHIIAVANGGSNDRSNLCTACQNCNRGKSDKPLTAIPKPLVEVAQEAIEREAQVVGYAKALKKIKDRIDSDAWTVAKVFMVRFGRDDFRRDFMQSVIQFLKLLPTPTVVAAMEIATSKYTSTEYGCFKYFCGVCWKTIKGAPNERQ